MGLQRADLFLIEAHYLISNYFCLNIMQREERSFLNILLSHSDDVWTGIGSRRRRRRTLQSDRLGSKGSLASASSRRASLKSTSSVSHMRRRSSAYAKEYQNGISHKPPKTRNSRNGFTEFMKEKNIPNLIQTI